MIKLQSIASQLCAALPYYLLRFANGSASGFLTILITELYKENAEITMTLDQLSWLASINIVNIPSCIIYGILTQRIGSCRIALATALLYIISWLLYFYSTHIILIFICRMMISAPSTNTLCGPYISEISEPSFRGLFLTINFLSNVIGTFFSLLLGSFMYWRTIALVNLSFPVASAFLLYVVPNSPTWLANKGRFDEAEKALCWLRGWVKPEDVQIEYQALVDNAQKKSTTSTTNNNGKQRLKEFFENFHQRSFYTPLATIFIIFTVYCFSGVEVTFTYGGVIYQQLNSPIDASLATAINGIARVTGALTALFLTKRTGKRKLVFFSVTVATFCYMSIAIVGFFKLQSYYLWISTIAMIFAIFANATGIEPNVYTIVSEIFPSSVRYIGTSIAVSIAAIMCAIIDKLFLHIVETISLPGIFLMFTCVNLVAFVTYYFLFPETEGKSLNEIEDHYKANKVSDNVE